MPQEPSEHSQALRGLRVLVFESRRGNEMGELIRRHGGEPISAPALREVPLAANAAALDYLRQLEAGAIDVVLLLTGVGLRTLLEVVSPEWPRARVAAALGRAALVARGPKPAAALRELQLQPTVTVPEPNTWRDVLHTLDAALPVDGKCVAVQEYGAPNPELIGGLEERGATVLRVPIYRWALPEDVGPLQRAVRALCDGTVDVALFTSATQVVHLFQVAGSAAQRLREGLGHVLVGSIGPICSDGLRAQGITPDLEPEHSKMGHLVSAVARRGPALLADKRARQAL